MVNAIVRNVLGGMGYRDIVPKPSESIFDFMFIGLSHPQDVDNAESADLGEGGWFWLDGSVYDNELFYGNEPYNVLAGEEQYGVEEYVLYKRDDPSWYDLPPTYLCPALYKCCIPDPAEACTEEQ